MVESLTLFIVINLRWLLLYRRNYIKIKMRILVWINNKLIASSILIEWFNGKEICNNSYRYFLLNYYETKFCLHYYAINYHCIIVYNYVECKSSKKTLDKKPSKTAYYMKFMKELSLFIHEYSVNIGDWNKQ